MSIAAINAVTAILSDPEFDLAARPRLVLVLLANFAGKDGTCHPSRRRLAGMANASASSIKRDLAELAGRKLIEVEERYNTVTGARAPSTIKLIVSTTPAHSCDPTPVHGSDPTNKPTTEPTSEPSLNPDGRPTDSYCNLKAACKGSTDPMLADVQRFMGPLADRQNAMKWLTGTLTRYGEDRAVEAWTILTSKAGQGQAVTNPLAFWTKVAGGLTAKPKAADLSNMVFKPSRYGQGRCVPKEAVQ